MEKVGILHIFAEIMYTIRNSCIYVFDKDMDLTVMRMTLYIISI